jgi:hypothetical protein
MKLWPNWTEEWQAKAGRMRKNKKQICTPKGDFELE